MSQLLTEPTMHQQPEQASPIFQRIGAFAVAARGIGFARTGSMNLARFRPSSTNPHKSVSNVEFNQVMGREQSQQLDTKIN